MLYDLLCSKGGADRRLLATGAPPTRRGRDDWIITGMRLRSLGLITALAWLVLVGLTTVVTDMDPAPAVLFAVLGLLVVAGLVVLLSTQRLVQQVARDNARARTADSGVAKARQAQATKRGPVPAKLRAQEVAKVRAAVDRDLKRTFRQVEAMQNLYAMIDIKHALPASRGWPASPDLLLLLVDLVDRHRPKVVVECGSGLSTLCLALAMRRFGIEGKVIALEHLAQYAEQTRELLRRHGVDDIAEVRVAPLEPVKAGEVEVDWYSPNAWQDLTEVDLLFVDGPPSSASTHARYPSLPFFVDRLVTGSHIVLDDYQRDKEQLVVDQWIAEYTDRLTLEKIPLEKGAALLTFE
ncbi:hypothetical protein ASG90_05790 [Nocardioides sp. Soil797]|nr:hypothetical protein ASG90_05790 [Nocardioides sp. Soil797]